MVWNINCSYREMIPSYISFFLFTDSIVPGSFIFLTLLSSEWAHNAISLSAGCLVTTAQFEPALAKNVLSLLAQRRGDSSAVFRAGLKFHLIHSKVCVYPEDGGEPCRWPVWARQHSKPHSLIQPGQANCHSERWTQPLKIKGFYGLEGHASHTGPIPHFLIGN